MYRVLARKYRPTNFDDLIGQDVLVRTLSNAFASDRIAHAFMLTGIRGIGKTTTARIIARGLNCIGEDGNGGPTTSPCGVCPNCNMIGEDRHVDVIEMDAASRTGVDDIREIIDSVHYAPVSGRYKIYIIDEVHMLSKNAFNALLKTLEEPPPHVKFIFATTEIRKIPVTIISRCQRFDLRRLDTETMTAHLVHVAKQEHIVLSEECAGLIAASAEGSVRDGLSILDQAIAMHSDADGTVSMDARSLRDMLGMANKSNLFALLKHCFEGAPDNALARLNDMLMGAAEPSLILGDMLEIAHFLCRVKAAPALASTVTYSAEEQTLAKEIGASVGMASLTRAWKILTDAQHDMRSSTNPRATLEMALVRLAYASQLPSPDALIRQLENDALAAPSGDSAQAAQVVQPLTAQPVAGASAVAPRASSGPVAKNGAATAMAIAPQPQAQTVANPESFEQVVALFEEMREPILHAHLRKDLRLVQFAVGRIALQPASYIAPDVPSRIQRKLRDWTGNNWQVAIVDKQGDATLAEEEAQAKTKALNYAASQPLVKAIMHHFPEAEIIEFIPKEEE
jgi:DNA polymerase-3 subunit gamma/tau